MIAAALGWSVGDSARRRNDARLALVSLSFVASAAFLGLHALATPRVVISHSNAGILVAVPVGLVIAAPFALWSAIPLEGDRARWVMRHTQAMRLGLIGVVVLWAEGTPSTSRRTSRAWRRSAVSLGTVTRKTRAEQMQIWRLDGLGP